jgi:hypothetical protein
MWYTKWRFHIFLLLAVSILNEVIGFFNWRNASNRNETVRSTQVSTQNLPVGKEWPERKADNLTAICEPIV